MKILVFAAFLGLSLLTSAKEPNWSAMVESLVGSWKSYKSVPGEGFPEGMEVPNFVVEITINADGTATRKTTVEGKVIEDKKVVYCLGTEFIVFCDDDSRKGGVAPMMSWRREDAELLLNIVGGGAMTLHLKKVEAKYGNEEVEQAGDGDA